MDPDVETAAAPPDPATEATADRPSTPPGRAAARSRVDAVLGPLLHRQDGVVSRRQLVEAGVSSYDVERLLRRRELTRMHPGVFVDHTGVPSLGRRRWAGRDTCGRPTA